MVAGQPRFAQQTLSSQRRQQQQSKQPASATRSPVTHSTPALLHSSTPFTLQGSLERQKEKCKPVPQSAKKQQREPLLSKNHTSLLPDTPSCDMAREDANNIIASLSPPNLPTDIGDSVSVDRHRGSASSPCLATEYRKTPKITLTSPVNEHRERDDVFDGNSPGGGGEGGVDGEQRVWMESVSATLAHHSQQLETFKRTTQKQLGQLQQKLSSQGKARKRNEEEVTSVPTAETEGEKSEGKEAGAFDGRNLEGLMERLRELEGEEEVIRERWRSITYEDPPLAKPPILYPCAEHPSSKNGRILSYIT